MQWVSSENFSFALTARQAEVTTMVEEVAAEMMTLKVEKGKFKLKFPYNERMILKAKSIPGARWSKLEGCWEYPLSARIYERIKQEFKIDVPMLERIINKRQAVDFRKYRFKTTPYQHQLDGVKFILRQFGCEVREE